MRKKLISLFFLILSVCALSACSEPNEKEEMFRAANAEKYAFGSYEQDGNEENGAESIIWLLMAKRGDKALLVSKYALDTVLYSDDFSKVNYAESGVYEWLQEFYNKAFTKEEKGCILVNENREKVFIPSPTVFQASALFDYSCTPTAYAQSRGVYSSAAFDTDPICWWFVSSTGKTDMVPCAINKKTVSSVPVNTAGIGIRPAIWVDLNQLLESFTLEIEGYDEATFYFEGDSPRLGDAQVFRIAASDHTSVLIEEGYTISPKTFTHSGRQYITVDYEGKKAVLEAFVYGTPTSVEVVSPPSNLYYAEGGTVDLNGLVLKAVLASGREVLIDSNFIYEPKQVKSTRDNLVTVTVAGTKAQFSLDVSPAIESLVVETQKESFEYGEVFDPADFTVTATFSDGTTESLPQALVFNSSAAGIYTDSLLSFSYRGMEQTVQVKIVKKIDQIRLADPEYQFYLGHSLPSDYFAVVVYASGFEEEIPLGSLYGDKLWDDMITGTYYYCEEDDGTVS